MSRRRDKLKSEPLTIKPAYLYFRCNGIFTFCPLGIIGTITYEICFVRHRLYIIHICHILICSPFKHHELFVCGTSLCLCCNLGISRSRSCKQTSSVMDNGIGLSVGKVRKRIERAFELLYGCIKSSNSCLSLFGSDNGWQGFFGNSDGSSKFVNSRLRNLIVFCSHFCISQHALSFLYG